MDINKKPRKDQQWFKPAFDFASDFKTKKARIERKDSFDERQKNTLANEASFNEKSDNKEYSINVESGELESILDKFKPTNVSDLAVHKKKIEEVQDWLKKALSSPCRNCMLLLTGSSGCGKTSTVELLAQQLGVMVSEWVTPIDLEYVRENGGNCYSYFEKQSDKFSEFLLKASSFPSLLQSTNTRRIILVEDFPNSFLRDPSEFHNILQIYKDKGKSPLVFICTDTKDGGLNVSWNLFPANVLEKYGIDQISFNPVAVTGMKQALKRITTLLQKTNTTMRIPDQECIDSIINSSMGDIRSAVNNLHFACLKGGNILMKSEPIAAVKKTKGKRGKEKYISKLTSMGKDETLTIMHGVGRVLNPKLTEKLTAKDHQRFTHTPESIVDCFQMQPDSFVGFIHENYLPHFSDINCVEWAADALSDADCFMNEWRERFGKFYGLTVAVSGVMVANKVPVSSWHPIKAPKKGKPTYPTGIPLVDKNQLLCGKVLATDFKGFCNIIYDGSMNEDKSLIEEYSICE